MSKIVVLMGSPRKGGNTDLLARAFVEGASAKHEVELIPVADYKINPCIGCNACFAREGRIRWSSLRRSISTVSARN